MRLLTYTNSRGESLAFKEGSSFVVSQIDGLGDVGADIQVQRSPYQDGSSYIDSSLETRFIELEVLIRGDGDADISSKRSRLSHVFNPRLGVGTLDYRYGNTVVTINVVSEHVPFFPIGRDNRGHHFQRAMINLLAPNPYWRSPNETAKPLLAYTGRFTLPMTFPFELGVAGSRTTLYNDGDVDAPVRIEIKGPTKNPNIINRTTGENIKINRTIAEGETMYINTERGKQRIVVVDENGNESNAFGYLDHGSTLFYLWLGENNIEHVADAGNRHAEALIKWDSLYVGV